MQASSSVLGGEAGKLWQLGAELMGDFALHCCGLVVVLASGVAMKAETARKPILPSCASALGAKGPA